MKKPKNARRNARRNVKTTRTPDDMIGCADDTDAVETALTEFAGDGQNRHQREEWMEYLADRACELAD